MLVTYSKEDYSRMIKKKKKELKMASKKAQNNCRPFIVDFFFGRPRYYSADDDLEERKGELEVASNKQSPRFCDV